MKKWNVKKMYRLYLGGKTLAEVGNIFNTSSAQTKKLFDKNNLKTRGLMAHRKYNENKKLSSISFEWENQKTAWDLLDSKVKGEIAENLVKNKLLERRLEVWQSVTPNGKCDIIIWNKNTSKIQRLQIKTATYIDKRFRANLTTRDKNKNHIKYQKTDIDFFIIYCPFINGFYVVPFGKVKHTTSLNLIPHRERLKIKGLSYEKYFNAFDLLCK